MLEILSKSKLWLTNLILINCVLGGSVGMRNITKFWQKFGVRSKELSKCFSRLVISITLCKPVKVKLCRDNPNFYWNGEQAGHFPTNGRNSPTWGNFTLCRRKYILPRREKMSMFASVFTVAEKSHFDNSSSFKTNQYSIYVCWYQHPKWLQ